MKCNGKCFLMKKLKAAQKHNQQNLPLQQDELRTIFYTITELPQFQSLIFNYTRSPEYGAIFSNNYHTFLFTTSPPPETLS